MATDDRKHRRGPRDVVASAPTLPLDDDDAAGRPAARERVTRHVEGKLLGGRYRVVRYLARGGMGEVYEVHDQELDQRVALKQLLAHVAADDAAIARFKREIQLARLVTHPNVCRIFELGQHSEGERTHIFLTMELLRGPTLADELARRGRLPPPDALPIARQLAEGLAAAHEVGVIHRDFKCGNVILVPRESGVRAVVTDFGLAWAPQDGGEVRVSRAEGLLGTPAYMAPEQVSGGEVGVAADQYAFGVVLFEMVTGRLPFEGPNDAATAAMRLIEAPPSPRSVVPELGATWERTILRCLARDPADRFAGVREAVTALVDGTTTRLRRPARRRRLWGALAGAALLLGVTIAGWRLAVRRPPPPPLSVVVLPLRPEPESARDGWVAAALREGATATLAGSPGFRALDGDEAAAAAQDVALGETARLTDDKLTRLRRRLGAARVVAGSYHPGPGGAVEVRLAVQDAETGTVIAEARATAPRAEAALAGARAAGELAAALGRPASAQAVTAGARLGTARAWLAAHDGEQARAAARSLCADEAAPVRAQACELAGDAAAAADLLAPRAAAAGATLEELLAYARVAGAADRRDDALAALRRAESLPGSDGEDPRPLLAEASLVYVSDPPRALAAAARALARADARGARGAQVDALAKVAWLSWHQGDLDGALRAAERGRALAATLEKRSELADILGLVAALHWQRGELGEAAERQDEVVALAREVGDATLLREALNNAGMMRLRAGDLPRARTLLVEAAALGYGAPRFGLAWLRALGGDADGARREWRSLLAVEREEYIRVFFTIRLGELDAATGDAAAAREGLEAALAAADRTGIVALRAEAHAALADLLLDAGRPSEAEAMAQAAADEAGPLEARDVLAHVASIRARLALARGRLDEARAAAAAALDARHDDALVRLHVLAELAAARRQLARTPAAAAEVDAELREAARAARGKGLAAGAARLEAALAAPR